LPPTPHHPHQINRRLRHTLQKLHQLLHIIFTQQIFRLLPIHHTPKHSRLHPRPHRRISHPQPPCCILWRTKPSFHQPWNPRIRIPSDSPTLGIIHRRQPCLSHNPPPLPLDPQPSFRPPLPPTRPCPWATSHLPIHPSPSQCPRGRLQAHPQPLDRPHVHQHHFPYWNLPPPQKKPRPHPQTAHSSPDASRPVA
jgi:hypothetical protein